jgi:FkbM family methyltransferase
MKSFVVHKLLPAVNRAIRFSRLKIVPASSPTRSFNEFISHLARQGVEFGTIIDVGVGKGTPGLHYRGPQLFLVEPDPRNHGALNRIAERLSARAFPVAAGSADGELEFNSQPSSTGSSFFAQAEGPMFDGRKIKVPVRRLDGLIDGFARPALLKIDTQGFELEVVEGAQGILDKIDVIILETSFHPFRHGAPEACEVFAKMAELGFVAYEALEGHYRQIDNAMAQVDFVFVKPDSPLRRHKTFFSPEQARAHLAEIKRASPGSSPVD